MNWHNVRCGIFGRRCFSIRYRYSSVYRRHRTHSAIDRAPATVTESAAVRMPHRTRDGLAHRRLHDGGSFRSGIGRNARRWCHVHYLRHIRNEGSRSATATDHREKQNETLHARQCNA